MSSFDPRLANLSPQKLKLLELLLKEQGVDLYHSPILRRNRDGNLLPTSFAQQRLWFLDQLEPGLSSYNIPFAVRLTGRLDPVALGRSINEIVRRHETLRTTFAPGDEHPLQVIDPMLVVPTPFIDLCSLSASRQQMEVRRLADNEARQPFDLSRGPLLRMQILKLGGTEHVVLLTMHHIISDGWSIAVFVREMAVLYDAFSSGRPSPLPELSVQYADFAHWQRQYLSGEELDRQLGYWKNQLGGDLPVLELPMDRPRPPVQTFRGNSLSSLIPKEICNELKTFTLREGATLFMTLLAAFQVLLYRHSGQEDICVGTPIANRNRAEIEPLIGFFVNTLVMRTDLSGEPTFRELLQRVRATTLKAYENQDVPFQMIVEAVRPDRDTSYNPLFQAMFILQNAMAKMQELPGLSLEIMQAHTGSSTFDLTMSVSESPEGLDVAIEYNRDLFDRFTIEKFLARFEVLLRGVAADPELPVSDLPLLTDTERDQLSRWTRTSSLALYEGDYIHRLFEARADLTPDAIALAVAGAEGMPPQQVTYRELNLRANRLARRLRDLGVGPETAVGICMERSAEMIEGILGILKSGGAYLALDPSYPSNRLSFMIEDSGVEVILTQEKLRTECSAFRVQETPTCEPEPGTRTVICLDSCWEEIARESGENLSIPLDPENLAYVVYTSGSTGRPKGVLVRHRNLLNAYLAWEEAYALRSVAGHLQMASFAFDVFSGDLVRALCSGGRLVLCPKEFLLEPKDLYRLMIEQKIECAEFVPAVLRSLVQYLTDTGQDLAFMRLLICGSDIWTVKEYEDFGCFIGPDTRLINSFGLAEATIDSTYYEDRALTLPADRAVPMGRPFAGSRIYVLDRRLKPQPIGVPGELHVGGLGVASGYLQRPDLTAERFVPDPFAEEAGARLYRTGDFARFLQDGNAEFLGRLDHQVKIRGFRIEIGEIESTLKEHPGVQDAVVIAAKAGQSPGSRKGDSHLLAAYLVAQSPGDLSLSDLRAFLKSRLPDYMVPSAFTLLDSLPLSPNGKVDRKALPPPDYSASESLEDYIAPRTPTEEMLAGIWGDLLGLDRISVRGNFFDLGGHSLLATQLLSRVRSRFEVEIPLRSIFEWPTLEEFARQVEIAKRSTLGIKAPLIVPVPRNQDLPLSFSQQRLWFFDQLEPQSPLYNVPDALRLSGRLDVGALKRSIREIVGRHEVLRTTFHTFNGKPKQVIGSHVDIPLPMVDLSGLPPAQRGLEAQRLAAEEARRPFNLAEGPLLRTGLLRLSEEDHVALMTMHHIVSDGWSSGVLVREIASLYNAFLSGKPSPLERLPVQYADFACWQRQWLQGEVLETQLGYWTKQLGDSPPLLALPADRPRPAYQTDHGGRVLFTLPQGLYAALKSLGDREGATLFMTLLAGFKALLFRYTGQDDISIGTPIANRNRAEIERMIGCFINTLVLRTDLSGDPTFGELLHRVRKASLEAYMHQDLPFEMVVDALKLDRDTSYSPLFQVMFILQNAPMEDLDLAGLKIRPMEVETGVSTFDLTLVIGGDEAGLSGSFEYNSDLFDAATIERMATHFRAVLEGATSDPDRSLSCLPLLRQEEKEVFLDKWGKAEASYPRDACVHHLFEARVALTPDATALVVPAIDGAGCRMMSYRELNRRSNRLAHRLRRVGFGPEKVAGLCVDRTLEMIVGALGILKAGGSFVALDPQYPDERLELILQDARAAVLMVQERHASRLPFSMPAFPCPLLLLDLDPEGIAPGSDDNPSTGVDPGNLAYVVYTSGSTGKPKGVLVRHRNLVNAFFAWQSAYRLCEVRTHLQMAGVAFDVFCGDLVRALCSGGRLVLCPRDFLLQPERLHDLLVDENVECAEFVPAVLRNLAAHLEATGKDLRSMRLILCGSDIWYEKEYKYLLRFMAPQGRLINSFGLAEATVDSSFFEGPELCFPEDRHVPIGRPFANTSLYVLDNHLHPQPIGVTGEIHIGGMGISTGYLNRSDLTGGKFIPDPFSNVPGARLYKTGDMGRYLPDGNVEYLGRSDDQVKIRGFRIELGEVETLLKQHSRVKDVVVTAVDGRGDVGGKRLAAYLVPSEKGVVPSSHELRTFLRERLPDYMVPSAFMVLDELPLTPTGKVNRRALPALTHEPIQESGQIAPRTGEEEILAQIWCDVLGVSRVGVHENFFELGGDSILTVQVVARANQLGFRLTPRHLFELPTVAELALLYGKGCAIRAEQGIVTGPAPLTPIQLWFFEQGLPEPHHWNQTVLLRTRERLKPLQLEKALAHLISHHDALRLRFEHSENGWRQFHASADEKAPFLLIDLSELSDRDQGRAVEEHSTALQASLNLSDGPMLRVALFDLGSARPGRLLIAVHHLVMDGVSWRIFLQDLLTAYGLLSSGKRLKLPPKTTSFQYWSQRLQDRAREEELRKELHHWLRHAGADAARLPLDFPGGENSEKSAETVTVSLGPEETEMLLREVPAAYRTEVNDALLAALLRVVSRWTGSRTVLVELEGHGREDLFDDVDVSRTVGWFTSFYPVNLGLPRADGPGELLKAVKEQLRQAPSKGIGYGLLRYLCPDQQVIERMKSLPQPEIAFNYLGQFDQTLPEDSPFDAAEESQGPDRSLKGRLSHLLEINGGVSKGRLTLEWTYSGNLYRRATIMELAQDYLAALQEIISHCRSPEAGGISPSDFSLARLDQKKLDKIISKVSKKPFHPQRRENISSRAVTSQLVRD